MDEVNENKGDIAAENNQQLAIISDPAQDAASASPD
jgi:hypothetical protein